MCRATFPPSLLLPLSPHFLFFTLDSIPSEMGVSRTTLDASEAKDHPSWLPLTLSDQLSPLSRPCSAFSSLLSCRLCHP